MTVYFVTRFSIYDPKFLGFRLTADHNEEEYEKRLFSRDRLDQKFETFQAITLPSVVEQSCPDWRWLIYTSDRMPHEYMARLRNLVKDHANIALITVTGFGEFFERDRSYDYGNSFGTVRLDDDDGLNRIFVEKLQGYSERVGSVVSFTEGALVRCAKGRVVVGRTVSARNSALGLTGIGMRIYACGRHSDINARYEVIYDSSPGMYLLCCSPFTDTQRGFTALERVSNRIRRLLSLAVHRPTQAQIECVRSIRKRLKRQRL
jgi:hypothetical protein